MKTTNTNTWVNIASLSPSKCYKHINDNYYYTKLNGVLYFSTDGYSWNEARIIPKHNAFYEVVRPKMPEPPKSEEQRFKQYLLENLKIETKVKGPRYGMSGTLYIKLKLGDEEISEDTVSLYELQEN